jgi:hypothetical protein
METSEPAKRERYQEVVKALMKLVEEIEEIEEGALKGLEQKIYQGAFELGRKWMQGRLNQGKEVEKAPGKIVGACGHEQHLVGYRPRQLLTVLGKVELKRAYYQCQVEAGTEQEQEQQCSHGAAPADALWGVHGQRTTPGVQMFISYLGARLTLEEAAETFSRLLPLGMSARQTLNLLEPVGKALAAQEDELVKVLFEQAAQKASSEQEQAERLTTQTLERMYIELDGILARLRRGSVPMEEKEQKRKGDVYREIKVGAVFRGERGRERSELAPDVWVDTPQAGSMRYVARRTAKGGFGPLLYCLALQGGLREAKQVVVLGDGAPWIWKLVCEQFPGAVQIVDLYHAQEHVWQVAHAVFGHSSPQATSWAELACRLLVHGQVEELVMAIAALPKIPPEPNESRSIPEKAVDYFTTNAERMRYPAFRAQGMHVGSGIVEAACKTVVSTRAKRTGMRWTPEGLDAVLALRTSVLNETYDEFWEEQPCLLA